MVIRQLTRMCEGATGYGEWEGGVAEVGVGKDKMGKDGGKVGKGSGYHGGKLKQHGCGKETSERVKFVEVPSFVGLVSDFANGYARSTSTTLLIRKTKKIN